MGIFSSGSLMPFLVALGVAVLAMMLFGKGKKKDLLSERVKQLAGEGAKWADSGYEDYEEYHKQGNLTAMFGRVLALIGVDVESYEKDIKLKLEQSGIDSPAAIINYVFFKKLGPVAGVAVSVMVLSGHYTGATKWLVYGIAGYIAYAGMFGADSYLASRKKKRQYILQRSYPDALDLVMVCVEAGLAMDAALSRVCRELESAHPEITKELNKTRIELTLLNDRPKALQNLAERTDMVAFRAFAGALLQSEKFGTSLTETLRVLSEDYRNTRMMNAENKANRLPALMTVPLMIFMMPAFIMILMGPAIIMLIDTWGSK